MSDFKDNPQGQELDAMTTTARLPNLDIEIVHRRLPDGSAEQISINVQATPSFEAFRRVLEAANPWTFWAQATRLAWFPWLDGANAMNAMMLTPWGLTPALRNVRPDAERRPSEDQP